MPVMFEEFGEAKELVLTREAIEAFVIKLSLQGN
jgi:hypothetical protein